MSAPPSTAASPVASQETPQQQKPPAQQQPPQSAPAGNLFHFAECTNCKHILPLSTTTEKYFAILSKDPRKPTGLGEKCMRCGADSWVLATDD